MYKLMLKQMMRNKVFKLNIILGLLILSYISGQNLSILKNESISVIEFVLFTLSNKFYFAYGMMSIFLLILFGNIGIKNEIYYIRKTKFITFFIDKNISNFIFSAYFVLLHIVVTALIGISTFKFYNKFNYDLNILNIYKDNFNTPILSLISMCLYMILGMFFITVLTEFVNYFFSKNTTILFLLMIYLSIWLGIRQFNYNEFYFIYLNNFLMLEYGIRNLVNLLIIEICVVFFILYFINKKWWIRN